jgi:hypothetical protein
MLQRSVADRWVQSDHISLIHPCSETLPFALMATKFSERMYKFYRMLSLFYIIKVARNRARTSVHVLHRLAMLC